MAELDLTLNGHALEHDPPAALTAMRRWTCFRRTCGMAVLMRPDGSLYGSATEKRCPEEEDSQ